MSTSNDSAALAATTFPQVLAFIGMESETPTHTALNEPTILPPPAYADDFNLLYQQWSQSITASKELGVLQLQESTIQDELRNMEASLKKLKEASSMAFEALHSKHNPFSSLLRSKRENEQRHDRRKLLNAEFERAHSEETKQVLLIDEMKANLGRMNQLIQYLKTITSQSNELWIKLSNCPEAQSVTLGSQAGSIGEQMERLSNAELSLEASSKVMKDIIRARLTIQHAHRYYSLVFHVTDELKPGSLGNRLVEGFAGELANMSRQNEYRDAITKANKSQVCLDEFFRVTEPHLYMFPEERINDYNALKKGGVKQVPKIYDLLYSGSSATASVRGSVQELLEKQELTFGHLTNLAVFIQDKVPYCEVQEKEALVVRDEARRALANIWSGLNATQPR